ncbi:MAG: hypothetical protein Q7T57_07535, partial [Dehalococcoidales bacterium]|nr:hypothetical protein [Dehalococcoidales bacterium]
MKSSASVKIETTSSVADAASAAAAAAADLPVVAPSPAALVLPAAALLLSPPAKLSQESLIILGTPSPPHSQHASQQHQRQSRDTSELVTPMKTEQQQAHIEIAATPSPLKTEPKPPRPPPAVLDLPSVAILPLPIVASPSMSDDVLPVEVAAATFDLVTPVRSSFRSGRVGRHAHRKPVDLPMPEPETPEFSCFSPSPTPAAVAATARAMKREMKTEKSVTSQPSQKSTSQRSSPPVPLISPPPPVVAASALVPPSPSALSESVPSPSFDPPAKHPASMLPIVVVSASSPAQLSMPPTPSQARREVQYLSEHEPELFASAKDEPNAPKSPKARTKIDVAMVIDEEEEQQPHTPIREPQQPDPMLISPAPVAVAPLTVSSPSTLPPPNEPDHDQDHSMSMHDDSSFIDELDDSATDCPGFIAPTMEALSARMPQRTRSNTVNPSALVASAAAAAFPVTPSSSSSTSGTNHSMTTPPRTPRGAAAGHVTPPRTPSNNICLSLQPQDPATPHVSPLSIRKLYPPPPDLMRARVLSVWKREIGTDSVIGSNLGDLLEYWIYTAQMENNVPYAAYAAFLTQILRDKPEVLVAMKMGNVSAKILCEMYPPSDMPTPLPIWDSIDPPLPIAVQAAVTAAAAAPASFHKPASRKKSPATAKSSSAAPSPAAGWKTTKGRSSAAASAAVATGTRSIMEFASTSGPSVAQQLAEEVTAAAHAQAQQLAAAAAAAQQLAAAQLRTPQRPSLDQAFQIHQAQLAASAPARKVTPKTPTPTSASRLLPGPGATPMIMQQQQQPQQHSRAMQPSSP